MKLRDKIQQDINQALKENLKDPEQAEHFLNALLEHYPGQDITHDLLKGLGQIAKAKGGTSKLAKETNLNRQNLYNILSGKTIPTLNTFASILKALGFRLSVTRL